MNIQSFPQKPFLVIVLGALSCAVILQRATSLFPRSRALFLLTGISAAATAALIVFNSPTSYTGSVPVYLLVLLQSFYIRASGVLGLAASGRDTFMWSNASQSWIEAGHILGSGMYPTSPFFILELVIGRLVLDTIPFGITVYSAGGITIAVASLFPLVLAALTKRITGSPQDAMLAAFIGAFFPLFLRSSTLLQAEHVAVVWFGVAILILSCAYQEANERRWKLLLIAYLLMVNFVHFFYAAIVIGVIF